MRIHKRSVFFSAAMFALCSVSLQIMGFLYRIGLSRLIGAQGMGVYGLVMPVYSVLQSFALSGLVLGVTRRSARYEALGQQQCVRATLRYSLISYTFLFAVAATPVLLFNRDLSVQVLGDARTRTALLILLPYMLLTGIENLLKAHFQGVRYILPPIVSELSEQALRIAAVLTLLYLFRGANPGVSAALILIGMVISEVSSVSLLGTWYTVRTRKKPSGRGAPKPECGGVLRGLVRTAIPVSLAGVCTNLLASATSVILPRRLALSGLAQEEALSAFGVMTGMTMPFVFMPAALIYPMVSVLVPKLSQACALGDKGDVRRKTAKGLHTTGIIAFGSLALLLSCGSSLARLLYRQETAGDYMVPLAFSAFFTFYQIITGGILNGIGRHKIASASIVLCSIIHLGFTWFACAVPGIGMAGYVAGDLISALFGAGFNLCVIIRHTRISVRVHNWAVRPLLSALAALFSSYLFVQVFDNLPELWSTIYAAGVCTLVYLATLRFQGVSLWRYLKRLQYNPEQAETQAVTNSFFHHPFS